MGRQSSYERGDRERHLTVHRLQFNSHGQEPRADPSRERRPALYADQWQANAWRAVKNFNEVPCTLHLSFFTTCNFLRFQEPALQTKERFKSKHRVRGGVQSVDMNDTLRDKTQHSCSFYQSCVRQQVTLRPIKKIDTSTTVYFKLAAAHIKRGEYNSLYKRDAFQYQPAQLFTEEASLRRLIQ